MKQRAVWPPRKVVFLKVLKSLIKEALELELKPLPTHLKYQFLGENDTLSVIISLHLTNENEHSLLQVLSRPKKAIR